MTIEHTIPDSVGAPPARSAGRAWAGALAMLLSVILITTGMIMTVGVGAAGVPVVAVYPPTWSKAESIAATARAGGPIVALGSVGWVVVTVSQGEAAVSRLRREGAVLLLNAGAARFCRA